MGLKKNYIYNVTFQICKLSLSFMLIPYIARVLGSQGVGIASYTDSIVQYFILFGAIGIDLYGNRAIAYVKDDHTERNKTFWSIFILKFFTASLSLILFLGFIFFSSSGYKAIFLIQCLNIIALIFDISWFFMGIEEISKNIARNMIIKLLGIILIFLYVKDFQDIWKYVLIISSANLLGQFVLWMHIPKYVQKIRMDLLTIKKHFFSSVQLFIPQVAMQIYLVLDKTMLGVLTSTSEVGVYEMSQRIVRISLVLVTSMGVVMLPRISNMFAKGEVEQVKLYIMYSLKFASYISIPIMFGLMGIANEFVPWFFGSSFEQASILIHFMSFMIIVLAFNDVIGVQLMLPLGKEKEFTIAVLSGCVLNFLLNLILIPRYNAIGATITTVLTEFLVTSLQLYLMRGFLSFKKICKEYWKYFSAAIVMYILIRAVGIHLGANYITTLLQVFIGVLTYFSLLLLLREEVNSKMLKILTAKMKVR